MSTTLARFAPRQNSPTITFKHLITIENFPPKNASLSAEFLESFNSIHPFPHDNTRSSSSNPGDEISPTSYVRIRDIQYKEHYGEEGCCCGDKGDQRHCHLAIGSRMSMLIPYGKRGEK